MNICMHSPCGDNRCGVTWFAAFAQPLLIGLRGSWAGQLQPQPQLKPQFSSSTPAPGPVLAPAPGPTPAPAPTHPSIVINRQPHPQTPAPATAAAPASLRPPLQPHLQPTRPSHSLQPQPSYSPIPAPAPAPACPEGFLLRFWGVGDHARVGFSVVRSNATSKHTEQQQKHKTKH